jgi:ribosomal protein S1
MNNVTNKPSMSDLLKKVGVVNGVKVGEKVSGTIIFINKNEILIELPNIGLGSVRGREMYNEEYVSGLKVGETIEAQVLELDNENNQIGLSLRSLGKDKIWSEITEIFNNKLTIQAKIRDANRGGFLVRVNGIDGFLPASLLSANHSIKAVVNEEKSLINQMKKYIGQSFDVKIININLENESLVVSEKSVSEEVTNQKLSKYKNNDIVEGTIVGIVDFGLFVRFDEELEGLVHISELAWKKIEDPRKEFSIGQSLKVKILDIDKEGKINLSIKQLLQNPWVNFSKIAKIGGKFEGIVTKITNYGVMISSEENIQGLCHITQIPGIKSAAGIYDILKVGDKKEFTILTLDMEENDGKLYLTLLSLEEATKIQADQANRNKEESKTE